MTNSAKMISASSCGPLIDELRSRWTRSPYPMIVDHAVGGRICPAASLYLGARRHAYLWRDRGVGAGTPVIVDAKPSADALMQIIGAIRLGATVQLASESLDAPTAAGLQFGDHGVLEERAIVDIFRTTHRGEPKRFEVGGDWCRRATWVEDLLPALAAGGEVHINLEDPAMIEPPWAPSLPAPSTDGPSRPRL